MIKLITSVHSINNGRVYNLLRSIDNLKLNAEKISYTAGEKSENLDLKNIVQVTFKRQNNYIRRALHAIYFPFKLIRKGDVVVIMTPDLVPAAALIRVFVKYRLIVDVSENYETLIEDRSVKCKWLIRQLLKLTNSLIKKSDLVTVYADSAPPSGLMSRLTLKNVPYNMSTSCKFTYKKDENPTIIYTGDLRKSRGLYDLIKLAYIRTEWKFIIVGQISGDDGLHISQQLSAIENIEFYRATTYNNLIQYLYRAWIGIIPLHSTRAFNETIPAKLYDYIASGLPIISYNLTMVADMVKKYNIGFIRKDVDEVSHLLKKLYNSYNGLNQYEVNVDKLRGRLSSYRKNFEVFEEKLLLLSKGGFLA